MLAALVPLVLMLVLVAAVTVPGLIYAAKVRREEDRES